MVDDGIHAADFAAVYLGGTDLKTVTTSRYRDTVTDWVSTFSAQIEFAGGALGEFSTSFARRGLDICATRCTAVGSPPTSDHPEFGEVFIDDEAPNRWC